MSDGGGGSGVYPGGESATEIQGEDSVSANAVNGGLGGGLSDPQGQDGIADSQGGGGGGPAGDGGDGALGYTPPAANRIISPGYGGYVRSGRPGNGGAGGNPGFAVKINNVRVVWVGGFIPDRVKGIVG